MLKWVSYNSLITKFDLCNGVQSTVQQQAILLQQLQYVHVEVMELQ